MEFLSAEELELVRQAVDKPIETMAALTGRAEAVGGQIKEILAKSALPSGDK